MNPLKSPWQTTVAGILLAIIISYFMQSEGGMSSWGISIWIHVIVGIMWIGMLYYFNFVQVPAVGAALSDGDPGPAAINKYVAPRALFYFRWAAVLTWFTGAYGLAKIGGGMNGIYDAFLLSGNMQIIGEGAWLGTIMLFNVWVLIWPNQKKILGLVSATPEEIAKAKPIALYASRTNVLLSIPMLMSMVGHGHGGFLPI